MRNFVLSPETTPVVLVDAFSTRMLDAYCDTLQELVKTNHSFELAVTDRTRNILKDMYFSKKEGNTRGYFV